MRAMFGAVALSALSVGLAGCGGDGKLKTYPVSGQILYNGQPLKGVDVAFHATDPGHAVGYPPHAKTDAEGKFKLTSYVPDDGSPAGEFRVAVAFAVETAGADDGGDQSKKLAAQVPAKYHRGETSGLTATVKAAATALDPFKLEGPPLKAAK